MSKRASLPSRLLDRLEGEGLIARERCDLDGRGQWIILTDAGRAPQARTSKVCARAIQHNVGDKFDENSATALGDLLGRLIGAGALDAP